MDSLDVPPSSPPPPPPKKMTRPKITLQIPTTPSARGPVLMGPTTPSTRGQGPRPSSVYWGQKKYHGRPPPITPSSQISDPHGHPYFNPFDYMGYAKASDFMVKNFTDFKDFTMSTAKSGLSVGEKTAFWFYNQLRRLSKKWFTHFFLTVCLALYSVMGAMIFMALEGPEEQVKLDNFTVVRDAFVHKIHKSYEDTLKNPNVTFVDLIKKDLASFEADFKEFQKHVNDDLTRKKTWEFWNSVLYAGTIYTTIGLQHSKKFISEMTTRVSKFVLNNSRSKARAIVGALTGHYATGTMMHKMKLTLDPSCRACGEDEETMEHILCDCDVLAAKRMCLFGNGYPKPGDLRLLPLNGVASFIDHVFEG